MKKIYRFLIIIWCSLLTLGGYSQEKQDSIYRVETFDGNEYVGKLISRDNDAVVLNTTQLGNITIKTKDIKSMSLVVNVKVQKGRYYFDNPQSSKYFFSQSGYGVKKGEGYYTNAWIFFNEVTYGVTNNFSISAGTIPLFLFAGTSTPVWINPKVSLPVVKDKVNLGIGAYVGTIIGEENTSFSFLYGNSTFGSRDKNITLGFGWGIGNGEISSTPLVTLAGMLRVSQRWYLMTENHFLTVDSETGGVLSFGARYAARRVGIDFGLFLPVGTGGTFLAAPWLGINVPFGKNK